MSLRDQVEAQLPGVLADLTDLVAIESVSADPPRTSEVERSRPAVAQLADRTRAVQISAWSVRRRRTGGHRPVPCARRARRPSASTPTTTSNRRATRAWRTRPSSRPSATAGSTAAAPPTTRAASPCISLRCGPSAADPPVGVTVFVEGEEEVGSPTLAALLAEHRDGWRPTCT